MQALVWFCEELPSFAGLCPTARTCCGPAPCVPQEWSSCARRAAAGLQCWVLAWLQQKECAEALREPRLAQQVGAGTGTPRGPHVQLGRQHCGRQILPGETRPKYRQPQLFISAFSTRDVLCKKNMGVFFRRMLCFWLLTSLPRECRVGQEQTGCSSFRPDRKLCSTPNANSFSPSYSGQSAPRTRLPNPEEPLPDPVPSQTYLEEAQAPSPLTRGYGVGSGAWPGERWHTGIQGPLVWGGLHGAVRCPRAVGKEQSLEHCPEPVGLPRAHPWLGPPHSKSQTHRGPPMLLDQGCTEKRG